MDNESTLTITTNHHARDLVTFNELPEEALEQFDYVDGVDAEFNPRFFRYRGDWYDTHQFQRILGYGDARGGIRKAEGSAFRQWDAAQTQSYWDAIVMKYARDWDGSIDTGAVVIGHATW